MSVSTAALPIEDDPVCRAVADPVVHSRLIGAAISFLSAFSRGLTRQHREADAEVIVAEAGLRAIQKRSVFDPSRDVVSWLVKFVNLRTREHCKEVRRELAHAPLLASLAADVCDASDGLADKELRMRLKQIRDSLPAGDRQMLRLKYDEGLTFNEIAVQMGAKDANTVRVRHHRLLERMRKTFGANEEDRP